MTELLASNAAAAFRWETPPISLSEVDRPFEFVITNDPALEIRPEPRAFSSYFAGVDEVTTVLPIPNLGKTAILVVPRQIGDATSYAHFARFLRTAPSDQVHSLWRCVAITAARLLSHEPLWISTAGGGVSWLHVRIENEPKYYSYRPYATVAKSID